MKLDVKINWSALNKAISKMPAETERIFKSSMRSTLNEVRDLSKSTHRFIARTGNAERAVKTAVSDKGLRGTIGIGPDPIYARMLSTGTKSKKTGRVKWSPDPWVENAFFASKKNIEKNISDAYLKALRIAGLV